MGRLKYKDSDVSEKPQYYRAGNRYFKTRYGAIRHLAKLELLREVEDECIDQNGTWKVFELSDQERSDLIFTCLVKKYPNYVRNRSSDFQKAITVRAAEIMDRK